MDDFVEGAGGEQHFIWTHADPLVGLFVVQQCDFIAEALLEKFVLTYCFGYGGCVGEGSVSSGFMLSLNVNLLSVVEMCSVCL